MERAIHHVRDIISDQISGSSVVLDKIIALFNQFQYGRYGAMDRESLMIVIKELSTIDSSLRIVHHFLHSYNVFLETAVEDLYSFIHQYYEKWEDVNERIAYNLSQLYPLGGKKILIHSNSGTVYNVLKLVLEEGVKFSVIQTESRPKYEGREMALKLARLGIPVQFICDAALGAEMPEVDVCLLGADVFTPTEFVNKIGSSSICCAASYYKKPVYVLSDSRKWSEEIDEVHHLLSPEDLWNPQSENIAVKNYFFESIDRELITSFVHE